MSNTFFSSDWHLGHESILRHTERGRWWPTIKEHDESIIATINRRVALTDTLYLLGDISLHNQWITGFYLSQINCRNKYLVMGNHDAHLRDFYKNSGLFTAVCDKMFFKLQSKKFYLDHCPSAEWFEAHHGSYHLHGHTHGNFPYADRGLNKYRIMDVGWDASYEPPEEDVPGYVGDYGPFSIEDVFAKLAGKEHLPHHGIVTDHVPEKVAT